MKQSSIVISSAAALVALIAISGIAFSSFAADAIDSDVSETGNLMERKPFMMQGISDETRQQFEEAREAVRVEMQARRESIDTALEAGNYNDWVEAVGEDAPILEKINAENFNRYVEANNLMKQARGIMEELGVQGEGFGIRGMKRPGGHGGMF